MKTWLHRLTGLLFTATMLASAFVTTGCIEAESVDVHPDARPLQETQLAEKVEALLPGTWATTQERADIGDLFIVFLGHDAVSGDVAVLIEADFTEALQAVSVSVQDNVATLALHGQHWEIATLGDEELVLLNTADDTSLRLHRTY